jgi:chemotaxis family two-component system sensor kinase Cph1
MAVFREGCGEKIVTRLLLNRAKLPYGSVNRTNSRVRPHRAAGLWPTPLAFYACDIATSVTVAPPAPPVRLCFHVKYFLYHSSGRAPKCSGADAPMTESTPLPLVLTVSLDNCADEPIHIPSQIQPHGTLLAFDNAGQLIGWADNAQAMLRLPEAPVLGAPFGRLAPSLQVVQLIEACLENMKSGETVPTSLVTMIGPQLFDCIAHSYQDRVIMEFETRSRHWDAVAEPVLIGQEAYARLKRKKSVAALLQYAVEQVKAMTEFDRVMAYRFRADDSGEVVAESLEADLVPFLGQRYPASDIPAQARRLYTINSIRVIPDVAYTAVPIHGATGAVVLDLSHSVLRSVSPIHIEYLQNMGVGASMSVSILLNGHLWGMIACHHQGSLHVPYAVRNACDVLAQIVSSTAGALENAAQSAWRAESIAVITALTDELAGEEELVAVLPRHATRMCRLFAAQGLVLAQHGKLHCHGDIEPALAAAIVSSLPHRSERIIRRSCKDEWPEPVHTALGPWVGALALSINPEGNGWLLILRTEQIESVRWGGEPKKSVKAGPNGMRLTPRGSFELWLETVRGRCEPWETHTLEAAGRLLTQLHRVSLFRHVETARVRGLLLAMLGHDLRDPLHAIQMGAQLLQRDERHSRLGFRIHASGARMQRLIGQVIDMSHLNRGAAIAVHMNTFELVSLIIDVVDEARLAHPSIVFYLELPESCLIEADADRLSQALSNLISNALHHGANMRPITLAISQSEVSVHIHVRNESEPLAARVAANLFAPFKAASMNNERNPGAMGLGLYIVHEVMAAHGGSISYRYEAPHVVFDLALPRHALPEAKRGSVLFAQQDLTA